MLGSWTKQDYGGKDSLLQMRASQVWLHQSGDAKPKICSACEQAQGLYQFQERWSDKWLNCESWIHQGVIDKAISLLAPSRRVVPKKTHAGHQHSGGQMASSLLGEQRTWARAARCLSDNYFSALVAWWIAFLPWKDILVWRTSTSHLKSGHALFGQHQRKSFIFQIISLRCSFLNILYQLPYPSKATAIMWSHVTIS